MNMVVSLGQYILIHWKYHHFLFREFPIQNPSPIFNAIRNTQLYLLWVFFQGGETMLIIYFRRSGEKENNCKYRYERLLKLSRARAILHIVLKEPVSWILVIVLILCQTTYNYVEFSLLICIDVLWYMICIWQVYDMYMTCLWHIYDMYNMKCIWHNYACHILNMCLVILSIIFFLLSKPN